MAAQLDAGAESKTTSTNEFTIAAPPPPEHLLAELKTTLSGKLARRLGGISEWRKHPVDTAAKLIPSRFREGLGNVTVERTYDVDGAGATRPDADGSERVSEPVEYMPPPVAAGRRRVAIWTPHFGAGGMEQALFELAGQFESDSVESFLCATNSHDSAWLPLWRDRVTHLYDVRRLLPPEGLTAYAVSFARNWRPGLSLIHGLAELHALIGPIHGELRRGAKLAVAHRGSEAERELFSGPLDWLAAVDRHIVSSEAAAKWLYEMTVPETSISVIPPGVDCERFDPKSVDPEGWRERLGVDKQKRIVLFAGRLVEANNPLRVLDIAARLKDMRSEKGFHFVIAGDGPLQESLRSKITARDLAEYITLTGTVPDIRGLLAASAMLFLPATRRDLPQIVLESLAMELPVAIRRGDPVAGILGGDCLELVGDDEEEDVAFARAVDALLGNAKRRGELGMSGRQLVESDYPIEKSRAAWKNWLSSVVR
jgi:glycosyltransferase involved in cell wall biosynthesis